MMRTRGAPCSVCNEKVDKYDDIIKCGECLNSFHIKCVNVSVQYFNDLRSNDVVREWNCVGCTQDLDFPRHYIVDGRTTTITVTNDSSKQDLYLKIISELKSKSAILEKNASLLEFKISTLEKEINIKDSIISELEKR